MAQGSPLRPGGSPAVLLPALLPVHKWDIHRCEPPSLRENRDSSPRKG